MEKYFHSRKRSYSVLILIIIIIISFSSIHLISNEADAQEIGEEISTRSESDTGNSSQPDFDIQFMLDPSDDPLDPLYGEKWGMMEPGNEADYCILMVNMGSENDTYGIELNDPPADTVWDWHFLETGDRSIDIELVSPHIRDVHGGNSFKVLMVHIKVPLDALSQVTIELEATSQRSLYNESLNLSVDNDNLVIIIGHVYGLSIPPSHPSLYHAKAGEWITIPFSITNLGNKDVLEVDVFVKEGDIWRTNYRDFESHFTPTGYWLDFSWTDMTIEVKQGETYEMDLRFRIPSDIYCEDYVYQFRYIGKVTGTNYWMQSDVITVIAEKYSILSIEDGFPEEIEIHTGVESRLNMTLINTGWSDGVIGDIHLIDPKNVEMRTYNDTGDRSVRTIVPAQSDRNLTLGFSVDEKTPPGPINLQISIGIPYSDPIIREITLNVRENRDLKIIQTDPILDGIFEIGPDERKGMIVGARNNGNTIRKFNLGMLSSNTDFKGLQDLGLDEGWSSSINWISRTQEPINFLRMDKKNYVDISEFNVDVGYQFKTEQSRGISVSIDPGEVLWICFEIGSPDGIGGIATDYFPISIILVDEKYEMIDTMEIFFDVMYPDLDFLGSIHFFDDYGNDINSAEDDQLVFFRIILTNSGVWYSGETEMVLWNGRTEIGRYPIDPMGPGEYLIIEGNFTPLHGTDDLVVELDPMNEVIEDDDQFTRDSRIGANVMTPDFRVDQDEDESKWMGVIMIFLLILLMVLIIIASVVILSRIVGKGEHKRS